MTVLPLPNVGAEYGIITGRVIVAKLDDTDAGEAPDLVPGVGTVTLIPQPNYSTTGDYDAVMVRQTLVIPLDGQGYLVSGSPQVRRVAVLAGYWDVSYQLAGGYQVPSGTILVTEAHTQDNPLDITAAIPPGSAPEQPVYQVSLTDVSAVALPPGSDPTLTLNGGSLVLGVPEGGSGTDALTPVSADTTTPDGTTVGQLIGYTNTSSSAVTIDGVSVPAGQSIILTWDGDAWVQPVVVGAGGTTTLTAPSLSVTSVTQTTVMIAYAAPSGVTADSWQVSVDSGAWAALTGDTISGLTADTNGTISVRYLVGAQTSPSETVGYQTAPAPSETYATLTWGIDQAATHIVTGDASTGISVTATTADMFGSVWQVPTGADGGFMVQLDTDPGTSAITLAFGKNALPDALSNWTNASLASRGICTSPNSKWIWWTPGAAPAAGGIARAAGDILRIRLLDVAGTYTYQGHVSKDDGESWLIVGETAVATPPTTPVGPTLSVPSGMTIGWAQPTGATCRFGVPTPTAQSLTLSAGATGWTASGGGYAMASPTGYAYDLTPKDGTVTAMTVTGLSTGVAGPRVYLNNAAIGAYLPSVSQAVWVDALGVWHRMQTNANGGMSATTDATTLVTARDGQTVWMPRVSAATNRLILEDPDRGAWVIGGWPYAQYIAADGGATGAGVGAVSVVEWSA